jgi:hypothetical protein
MTSLYSWMLVLAALDLDFMSCTPCTTEGDLLEGGPSRISSNLRVCLPVQV